VHCLGVADFLTVLDAERTLLSAQDQLADSDSRTATALVAVYKALGGGGNSRRKGLTRRRLEGSQYEPCRAMYASWHQRLGGLPWARHELGTKRTLLMVGHKVGNQC
jgi:hypothetical protein